MSTNVWYVVITLKNGEVYQGIEAELGPRVTGDRSTADSQGIRLQRYGRTTFIPGQDVESVKWVECRGEEEEVMPAPEFEPELVNV